MDHKLACKHCGSRDRFQEGGFGLDTCTVCGLCTRGVVGELRQYFCTDRIMAPCTYTRRKRFKKYLMRANRNQSANTVPQETWEYLMERGPFPNPAALHRCLKAAKNLKRKCYDSLPLMCTHLCSQPVPSLSNGEFNRAMHYFDILDHSLRSRDQPMISYLFCLEFILGILMGRSDMLVFINRIKCPKRRQSYHERLCAIFSERRKHNVVRLMQSKP